MVKGNDVAKLFLSWANENGDLITNLKMQKLLYYAQAWYMVNYKNRLFPDKLEAWDLGPVIPHLYHRLKGFGSNPIDYNETGKEENIFKQHELDFLKEFYQVFSNYSATMLVSMTHNERPWIDAYNRTGSKEISPRQMREYYTKLYERQKEKAKEKTI